jgi:hypothetical protein
MMSPMGDHIQIHLSKPGGHQEGPYTLEQINRDLATGKYRDTDYWAWHEGLTEWVPLYALPGVSATGASVAPPAATPAPKELAAPARPQGIPRDDSPAAVSPVPTASAPTPKAVTTPAKPQEMSPVAAAAAVSPAPAATAPEPEEEPAVAPLQVSSGMPSSALEHLFVFTTGAGPAVWQSPALARMLEKIIGEDLNALRQNIPRDVVAECDIADLLRPDGTISDAVWRAMSAHRPALVQQAREKAHRICVRTFRIEADTVVALVLFYNKQKL